jgi:hypothetical protein
MKIGWGKLGGQLAIGYILAGFLLVFLGWNGAASYDNVSAQIPYLVSGGLGGLALVVLGAGLMVAQSNRADRAALQSTLDDLRDAVDRMAAGAAGGAAAGGMAWSSTGAVAGGRLAEVVAGPSAYHRPECKLVQGQSGVTVMTIVTAEERGLSACRICTPA